MNIADSAHTNDVQTSRNWHHAIVLIAALPVLQTLATWDFDGRLSPQAFSMRHYSMPAVIGELGVFWLAVRGGLSIKSVFANLRKSVLVLLTIWAIFALLALFWDGTGLVNASFILLRYTLHGFCLASVVFLLNQTTHFDKKTWLEVISIGGIAYAALLTLFCVLVPDPHNFPWILRIPSATNIRHIANLIGIMAIAPIALLLSKDTDRKWLYWIAVTLIMTFSTWTGSRSTIIGLLLGIGVSAIFTYGFSNIRNALAALSAAASGIFLSLPLPMPDTVFGLFRMINTTVASGGDASSGRIEIWGYTVREIMKSPVIGYGSGRFSENMHRIYGIDLNHPHNVVLQYAYDWGVIGAAVGLSLLAMLGYSIWRSSQQDQTLRFVAIAAFVMMCATAMIDSMLVYPLPIIIAIALMAPVLTKPQITD
jgi:O-Antigen ligase